MLEMTGEQHPLPVTCLWAEQVDRWRSFPPEPHPIVKGRQAGCSYSLAPLEGRLAHW